MKAGCGSILLIGACVAAYQVLSGAGLTLESLTSAKILLIAGGIIVVIVAFVMFAGKSVRCQICGAQMKEIRTSDASGTMQVICKKCENAIRAKKRRERLKQMDREDI